MQTALGFRGLGRETTYATAVVPTAYMSVPGPKNDEKYETLVDDGWRGNPAADQLYYQGVRQSTIDWPNMPFYPDDGGHLPYAILGNDAITGANPYVHALALKQGMPDSYTITDFSGATSGAQARKFVGCMLKKLDFKFVQNGKLDVSASWFGWASATVAKPSNTYSALVPFVPWTGALTLNGSGNTKLMELNLSLERLGAMNVYGSGGVQDPAFGFVGRLRVSGTALLACADETEYLLYANNTQGPFSFLLTQSGNVSLLVQMTKCAFETPTIVAQTKEYIETQVTFRAIANATDVSTAGAAVGNILINVKNAKSTAYST